MRRRPAVLVTLIATPLLLSAGGCGTDRLETGYRPRPLNASQNQRNAYYASPFSPEARKAQLEVSRDEGFQNNRPGDRF